MSKKQNKFQMRPNQMIFTSAIRYNCEYYGISFIIYSGSVGKELACNAGDAGTVGSVPRLGRSLEEGMTTLSRILAWRIPMTKEPDCLQSTGLKESDTNDVTEHSTRK